MSDRAEERARMVALLESQHQFPGTYTFRVVVRPTHRTLVVTALASVACCEVVGVTEKESRKGNYLSVRVSTQVEHADIVLDAYEVLQQLDGVLTVM